jgi:phosphoribosylformylglycinamidine synthase
LGLEIDLRAVPAKGVNRNDFLLFSESNSRFLIEVAPQDKAEFEKLVKGKNCVAIGKVTKQPKLKIVGLNGKIAIDASLYKLRHAWKKTLNSEEDSK